MKVSFLTMGCRVNQSESSVLEGTLKENGVTIVNLSEKPDFCVVNTCAVTSKGDYNSRQLIRRAARSGAKVIVTGCYAELKSDSVGCMPGVYRVVDNSKKLDIAGIIAGRNVDLMYDRHSRSRPHLKIQDGCNRRCSYCAVPLARGRSRSIEEDRVVARVRGIADRGYNEVVLTGIHLGFYGRDLPVRSDLKKLLRRILSETEIRRIRLSSLEINEVDDELIDILGNVRICNHLHLPLQSGSDRILTLMKRGYTASFFLEQAEKIALRLGNISLGSDVIVGFPGESEADFNDTLNALRNMPISYIHIFPFSPRSGTEASKMLDKVGDEIVRERIRRLAELNRLRRTAYMENQLDVVTDVILEEEVSSGRFIGTSGNYLKARVSTSDYSKGSLVYVRPVKVSDGLLDSVVIV